ncbi:MAG: restriction endonuclease, partial [Chloroflexi bacterium]|nr:restriction endonuclease [Chloroflexota bacterium]
MSPSEFEALAGQTFTQQGAQVTRTGRSGDGGVDLIVTRDGRVAFVQVKHWNDDHPVGSPTVRELYGAMSKAGVDEGYLITTSRFTPEARAFARG